MRPVRLTVAGMRSYRAQRTLDFSGRTLMAILGDTGSGKSSLLEALYGALYGGSTWDARGLGVLIADGVKTLQIELKFIVRGKAYTVSRSASRDNYPPAKHILDGPDGEHLDGASNVNRRIVQLVGLTDQEFLRVVILPQGRFGQLLQGAPGERTPILRGILGLGVLDRVKDVADRQAGELAAALEPIIAARARLYPDPAAVTAASQKRALAHEKVVKRLGEAVSKILEQDRAVAAVSRALPGLQETLAAAAAIDLGSAVAALCGADLAEREAVTALAALTLALSEREQAEACLTAALADATVAGYTPTSIAQMAAALDRVTTTLPDLSRDAAGHAREQAALEIGAAQHAADGAQAVEAARQADQARDGVEVLREAAQAAKDEAAAARVRDQRIRDMTADLAQRAAAFPAATSAVLVDAEALRAARLAVAKAGSAVSAGTLALTRLREANAAAHVAAQHTAGQPCPVCTQTFPAGFVPPEMVGERGLLGDLETAKEADQAAVAAERATQRVLDAGRHDLLSAARAAAAVVVNLGEVLAGDVKAAGDVGPASTAAVDTAIEQVLATTGVGSTPKTAGSCADSLAARLSTLTGTDDGLAAGKQAAAGPTLRELETHSTLAKEALADVSVQAATLLQEAAKSGAEHRAATAGLDTRRSMHEAATTRTTQAAGRLARDIVALPPLLAAPLISALNLSAADPAAALLAAAELPALLLEGLSEQLATKERELAQLANSLGQERGAVRGLMGQLSALQNLRRDTVDQPRARSRTAWERACHALTNLKATVPTVDASWQQLAAATDAEPFTPRGPEFTDDIDADCSDQMLTASATALRERFAVAAATAAQLVQTVQQGVAAAHRKSEQTLEAVDAKSVQELNDRLADTTHELRSAKALYERAQQQTGLAESLDVGITGLRSQLMVLRQVKDLLSPSAFPQYVVQQRQVALLRIASSLLGKLTRNGYGFGDDFMIVDRRTGQPRHPKTLSGGETFLASLALALALVEISNRSGGQLDCLFLDEGFGSLDSSILGEALDVLRTQATGGRLVGVISHLHAVAAELDDVLVVTKEIEGSSFRWLDPEERDAYLLDEAAAGLLS